MNRGTPTFLWPVFFSRAFLPSAVPHKGSTDNQRLSTLSTPMFGSWLRVRKQHHPVQLPLPELPWEHAALCPWTLPSRRRGCTYQSMRKPSMSQQNAFVQEAECTNNTCRRCHSTLSTWTCKALLQHLFFQVSRPPQTCRTASASQLCSNTFSNAASGLVPNAPGGFGPCRWCFYHRQAALIRKMVRFQPNSRCAFAAKWPVWKGNVFCMAAGFSSTWLFPWIIQSSGSGGRSIPICREGAVSASFGVSNISSPFFKVADHVPITFSSDWQTCACVSRGKVSMSLFTLVLSCSAHCWLGGQPGWILLKTPAHQTADNIPPGPAAWQRYCLLKYATQEASPCTCCNLSKTLPIKIENIAWLGQKSKVRMTWMTYPISRRSRCGRSPRRCFRSKTRLWSGFGSPWWPRSPLLTRPLACHRDPSSTKDWDWHRLTYQHHLLLESNEWNLN